VFNVVVDGTTVFSKDDTGRFPSTAEVIAAARALGSGGSRADG
jgi:hypothetical protein